MKYDYENNLRRKHSNYLILALVIIAIALVYLFIKKYI